jgi:Protein of unknown function (DUF3386)
MTHEHAQGHGHDMGHHPPITGKGGGSGEKCPAMQAATVTAKDQPEARALLQGAFDKTYRWPKGFGGFRADFTCAQAGQSAGEAAITVKGRVEVKSPREVSVDCDIERGRESSHDAMREWVQGQVSMMAVHRGPRTFEESDGKYVLTLEPEDGHPMGRLLRIHGDGMNSRYRIRDQRITQINRGMERMKFTINVEDSLATQDGRFLTTRYVVYYFGPADGKLVNAESFADRHAVVKGIYLPGVRRITSVEDSELITRELRFEQHALL